MPPDTPRSRSRMRSPRAAGPLLAIGVLVGLATVATGCGQWATPGPGSGNVRVVATTTILADLVRQVGGERVEVASLVPPGGEVHTFDPSPSDARRLAEADLIVINGLGLDDWAEGLAEGADATAPLVHLAESVEGVELIAGGDEGHGGFNPHLWLDVELAQRYVASIADALAEVDPDGAAAYADGAGAYDRRLHELDGWIREQLGAVPEERRRVVSFHDAFPYYARAYGLGIEGTIVDAPGQDPSAGALADLIRNIRASGVSVILAEAQFSPELAATIAAETGATVVTDLLTDSVGDPPVDTYEAVLRWDTERIAEALQ
jgi:manganese/iron transport system substrate-binding protein